MIYFYMIFGTSKNNNINTNSIKIKMFQQHVVYFIKNGI